MQKVLDISDIIIKDQLGCTIANKWEEWEGYRQSKKAEWDEVRRYIFAVDTTTTTNNKLPWKNKTTIPKLCQIRDNLYANYIAALFPKRKWLTWEAGSKDSNKLRKRKAIEDYMNHVIVQPQFKEEISKCVLDYIDYGNAFIMARYQDDTVELDGRDTVGYVGPMPYRISPLDIVFDPTASSFQYAPKIRRELVSLGMVKKLLDNRNPDTREDAEALWSYLKDFRNTVKEFPGEISSKDSYFNVDGFDSYRAYVNSGYCELLYFYGSIYDDENDELLENAEICVADRHKVIYKRPSRNISGHDNIFHVGWRVRQDNLWAMGPLDNLVGMQYRIDHVENLKADVFDLLTFPPLKIKGDVEPFEWGPMQKIYVSADGESDVEILAPPFQILQANVEIQQIEQKMEEMAGAPKEALGFRSPGEKTAFEFQRLENASSRLVQSKIARFEEVFVEPLVNAMLGMAQRYVSTAEIRVFDDELGFTDFRSVTREELAGVGRIRPVAARHFAERAEKVQNLTQFFSSAVGGDPEIKAHFSTVKLAKMCEDLLNIHEYELVTPYIRISEQAEAQKMMNAAQEQVAVEAQTSSGLTESDFDEDAVEGLGMTPPDDQGEMM